MPPGGRPLGSSVEEAAVTVRRAYVQLGGRGWTGPHFLSVNFYLAWRGFTDRGVETVTFTPEQLDTGALDLARRWAR